MNPTGFELDDNCLIKPDKPRPDFAEIAALLNHLYVAESRCTFRYLENWRPYTDARSAKLRTAIRAMMRSSVDHANGLSSMIRSLGQDTREGGYREADTHINFNDWKSLLPRLIRAKQDIIAAYERVAPQLGHLPGGENVRAELTEFDQKNREHLAILLRWHDELA